MKWIFYVVVFIYMFYRAVYGVKTKDTGGITVEAVKYDAEKSFLLAGVRKTISCVAASKNQEHRVDSKYSGYNLQPINGSLLSTSLSSLLRRPRMLCELVELKWLKPDGKPVEHDPRNRVFAQENMVSSKYQASLKTKVPALVLVFTSVAVEDTGVWTCRSGDIKHNSSLCVIEPSRFTETHPVTVDIGRSITLSCQVQGDPEPRILWYRYGELITESNSKYQIMMKYNSVDSEGLLTIASLEAEDSGPYTCEAVQESPYVDNCTHIESKNISLQVNYPPVFKDANETKIVYATEGESVDLVCSASGYPIPTYTWMKDNDKIFTEFGPDKVILNKGGTEAVLTLAPNTYTWNQKYRCRAKNFKGDVYKTFLLAKTEKPTKPSEVQPYSDYDKIQFEMNWPEDITFPVNSVDVQYFKAKSIRGRKLKESDWIRSKLVEVIPDDVNSEGVYITLPDLDENTEYLVRLRAVNSEGKSPWTKSIVASTDEKPDLPEEPDESTEDEESTAASETQLSDSTFYGIFFAGGIAIIVVAAMFLMRMV